MNKVTVEYVMHMYPTKICEKHNAIWLNGKFLTILVLFWTGVLFFQTWH